MFSLHGRQEKSNTVAVSPRDLMINLMLITNDPELARFAVEGGVQRIFVDLEINGKEARQGHLDTLISNHSFQDISLVRAAIPSSELLVRLNPFYEGSAAEVDE